MTLIGVVDHGAGNLVSISQALERTGAEVIVAADPGALDGCDGVVLPGVGSAGGVMEGIRTAGFESVLRSETRPLLGICVGMQVLFESSAEDDIECLGLIEGRVERLSNAPRLPHIGWNEVEIRPDELFEGLPGSPLVYFVHSFAPVPADPLVAIGVSHHGDSFVAAVRRDNVSGTQFHPERSGPVGLRILANFVASVSSPVLVTHTDA